MRNLKNLRSEIYLDWLHFSSAFRIKTLEKHWKWYIGAIICWKISPYICFYWVWLQIYKICIRYLLIFSDIIILDLINIKFINVYYGYIRRFTRFILLDFWFVYLPKFIKKIFTIRFWAALVIKMFEKFIIYWGLKIKRLYFWIKKLVLLRIPMAYIDCKIWFYESWLHYERSKLKYWLIMDERRLIFLYRCLSYKMILSRFWRYYKLTIRYNFIIKVIDMKLNFIYYKYKFILFCRQVPHWMYFYFLDYYCFIKSLSLLKCVLWLLIYKVGEFLYRICLLIKYKFFKKDRYF